MNVVMFVDGKRSLQAKLEVSVIDPRRRSKATLTSRALSESVREEKVNGRPIATPHCHYAPHTALRVVRCM